MNVSSRDRAVFFTPPQEFSAKINFVLMDQGTICGAVFEFRCTPRYSTHHYSPFWLFQVSKLVDVLWCWSKGSLQKTTIPSGKICPQSFHYCPGDFEFEKKRYPFNVWPFPGLLTNPKLAIFICCLKPAIFFIDALIFWQTLLYPFFWPWSLQK